MKHKCTGISLQNCEIPKQLIFQDGEERSEEERQKTDALLEKHQPRKEEKEKETTVLSEKGKKISIKTEVASSSMKPFKE